MTNCANLFAVTAAEFDHAVIDASRNRAILVDFWAAWCGPCRALAPVLEQLAAALPDSLVIAKVDTDAEPELAARYGIRSLPTLMLFRHGGPVDQILGAQPLGALQALVAPHLSRASDPLIDSARAARDAGQVDRAFAALEQALLADPANHRIHPLLAEVLLDTNNYVRAAEVLRLLPANVQSSPEVARLETRVRWARLLETAPAAGAPGSGTDSEARYRRAIAAAVAGRHADALADLLAIVRSDRRYGDDLARKTMIEVFNLLEPEDPLLREYRTALARALN
jgi:putative thioredoxin